MKCKCGNKMNFIALFEAGLEGVIANDSIYWCESCGRLTYKTGYPKSETTYEPKGDLKCL